MAEESNMSATDRLIALLDHLGLGTAHFGTAIPRDIAGLAAKHPERLAGIVLCVPSRLDPAPFAGVADRVLMIAGERGPAADTTAAAVPRLPGAERSVLAGYDAPGSWSDAVADRTVEIAERMIAFLDRQAANGRSPAAPRFTGAEGRHAGISYRIEGSGPALMLLPFFLAPSQWAPAISRLAERFTVVTLGGPHLGGVASLEDRAQMPTYQAMFRTLIDLIGPRPGEAILEIGCGAGSLVRLLAKRLGDANPITGADVNPFLLHEAAQLAEAEGVAGRIRFTEGNAEALPFDDATFDCAYSVTVFEECDAERAIAEAMRVVRPGGRVGLVVRALDMPQWWNLLLPDPIARKVSVPPRSVAPGGVADRSLYRRMRETGFVDLVCFPSLVTLDRPGRPIWRNREDHVLSQLSLEELPVWQAAREDAEKDGLLFMAHPLHCAIGTKPSYSLDDRGRIPFSRGSANETRRRS
ncbi:MAG TPA: methyltransferase domain-containing protein [Stellaceae bacterium]|nr:methyltransferase domain-containing protein [Stellaceae bacterium]